MNFLLLRGLSREAGHWGKWPELLVKDHKNDRVLCLDLPGVGCEHKRSSPLSIEAIVEDIRERWLEQKGEGPWVFVALSMGGMVALQWLCTYPTDAQALVIMNSSSHDSAPLWKRLQPQALYTLVRALLTNDLKNREERIFDLTSSLSTEKDRVVDTWVDLAQKHPVSRSVVLAQLFAASQFHLPKKLDVPLLVLASQRDQIAHWSNSENIATHFRAPLSVHPCAGHDLPLDVPHWLVEQIRDFTSGNEGMQKVRHTE